MIRHRNAGEFGETIALLWLFAILNNLFRDVHEFTMASTIREILTGHVNGNPMSEELLFGAAFAVELLLLAFVLSSLLSPRYARNLNLFLVPLAIMGTIFGGPGDLDDYFFATINTATYSLIFILCWNWQTEKAESSITGAANVR